MTAITKDLAAAIAANRFGLGARPGDLEIVAKGPEDWLARQLQAAPPVLRTDGLEPSSRTLAQALELRDRVAAERRQRKQDDEEGAKVAAAFKLPAIYRPVYL